MARIDDLKTELAQVRAARLKTIDAQNVSVPGVGLTYQSMDALGAREAELTWQIESYYRGGPFGQILIRNLPYGVTTRIEEP